MEIPRGTVKRLLPFFLRAGNEENPAGLRGLPPGPGACGEPREPSPAPALSQSPSFRPLNILLLLCASSFASGHAEPSCLSLQLQPQPCLRLGTASERCQGVKRGQRSDRKDSSTPLPPQSPAPALHSPARTVRTGRVTPRPPPRGGGGWRPGAPPAPAGGGGSGGARAPRGACSPRRSGTR